MKCAAALFAVSLTLVIGAQSLAQDTRTLVIDQVSCAACKVELELVVTLGDVDGEGMLPGAQSLLNRDSRGWYYVSTPNDVYIWVFDSSGRFLHRLGGRGQGPGEFASVSALLIGDDDSIFAFDPRLRRMLIYSPDHEHIRTVQVPLVASPYSVMVGTGMVINSGIHSEERIGYPLHLLDLDGRIVRTFGSVDGVYRPDLRDILDGRVVAPAGRDAVWSGWWNQYVIERWDTAGNLNWTIRREADWFEPWWILESGPDVEPKPITRAIMQQGEVMWTMVQVSDPNWRSAVEQGPQPRMYVIKDRDAYKDTIIEALDIAQGTVLATTWFPAAIQGFVSPALAYGQDVDEAGNITMPIWKMDITNPGQ